jgi:carbonic anhydrase
MTPKEALDRLKEGNHRYLAGEFDPAVWSAARREEASKPDSFPFAAVLACSDCRVPVEILFGQGIGDLFTVRVAGGRPDHFSIASLDYAAEKLNVALIVALGHTNCAVVKYAMDAPPLPGRIPLVVDNARKSLMRLRDQAPLLKHDELLRKALLQHTHAAVEDVKHQCQLVRKRLIPGQIEVVGAIYDILTGEVEWL